MNNGATQVSRFIEPYDSERRVIDPIDWKKAWSTIGVKSKQEKAREAYEQTHLNAQESLRFNSIAEESLQKTAQDYLEGKPQPIYLQKRILEYLDQKAREKIE